MGQKLGKNKKRLWKWLLLAGLFLAAMLYCMMTVLSGEKIPKVTYSEFYHMVENGQVIWAVISEDAVDFKVKDDDMLYRTDNPLKDDFREFLLLHDVQVESETSAVEWIYIVSDMLFNIFFFGLIGFVAYKLVRNRTFRVVKHVDTGFDDVVGMEGLKKEFYQIMEVMKHPEKYKTLTVRMYGFSEYFISLPEWQQLAIINRTAY